jgi:hypothetical protein
MAEDDPFADLGETLEDNSEQEEGKPQAGTESTPSDTEDIASEENKDNYDPVTDTAFSYEAAEQRPFYAREESINDFDSWMKYELERKLSERGYQNIVVREMTDALLRTAVEEDLVQEVAERFEEARSSISESNE